MKRIILSAACAALLSVGSASAVQNTNSATMTNGDTTAKAAKKRGPIFRATKDQIRGAQTMLKQRGLYAGETTGKLDAATRAALKKYQEGEGIKVTGTLNRLTLEKMNITLTEKQRKM
ncbi:MAG TPA: peptidoglycan-binding domain-containing protein [Pyrinomonadaceae bacterium]|jgi:peptidoglycan hydrolase-like protein with peptidoglycan-binding domain|nr:peptidoglycan-binding domain-containing protein [Pyrinomonadaceae bacterium]